VVCFIADHSARNAAPMRCGVNLTGLRQTEDGRLLVANLIVALVSPGDFRLGGNEVRAGYKKS
jgi:hypothetical protein